jgi:hypothetical protein
MGVSPEGLMQKLEEEVKKQINVVFALYQAGEHGCEPRGSHADAGGGGEGAN